MKKTKLLRNIPFILTVFINILLFISVFFLMSYVQNLLNSDVKINLTEVVSQNKDVITGKLQLEMNNLGSVADQLSDRMSRNNRTEVKNIFLSYAQEKEDMQLFFATPDGEAIFPGGQKLSISGRNYFRLALEGKQNISDRTISRLDGKDIFVISVPVTYNGVTIGTIQKSYTPEEMYDLCSISLFSDQGYMYIINQQGYILISSKQSAYNLESDNYYRTIYSKNPEQATRLQQDIENDQAGFMETMVDGKKIFSAYTPIDKVYGWYLISSVDTKAVSPNASIVFQMFYVILCAVILIFTCSMLYFLKFKNKQQNNLKHIAFVDNVTHGNTFAKFTLDLNEILAAYPDRQFYILALDIDNFKYINNFYGFEFGDTVLRGITEVYSKHLAENERFARIYSDHFIILLEDASDTRLNDLFEAGLTFGDATVYLSAGLYPITNPQESVNLMLDKATMAAHRIKGVRYKRVERYSHEIDAQMIYNEQLKRSVEQALERKEILPYFQPKVDINTNKLVGAEALARWQSLDGRLVPPGDFIPMCEKTGLITAVDMTIFEQTLSFLKQQLDTGIKCVPISVNFSRQNLLNTEFLNSVFVKLAEYQVPPALIEVELTETIIFDNFQIINNFIDRLHANGLVVSMDDFGSGYSSLHMLKDVPIDILKIDRGFLEDTSKEERQKAIFSAIIQMAEKLHIQVVVEGVETKGNVQLMQDCGCYVAQGYYYAKPMDRAAFEQLYQKGEL